MNKQTLSISQMEHLQSLGLDTSNASMCWTTFNCDTILSVHDEYCYESSSIHPIPTFTLQDILDLLPTVIKHEDKAYYLTIGKYVSLKESWYVRYSCNGEELQYKVRNDLLEVAYEMLCWCIENGFVKVKEK